MIILLLSTISKTYKVNFYFYLDDSLSTLIIEDRTIFSGRDTGYIDQFYKFGPYDINLGSNKNIILKIYNIDGPWALVGYIEIDGYRFYTNNPLLSCDVCPSDSKQQSQTDSYNKKYYGYKGQSDDIHYFKFTFQIPKNELELKQKSNTYEKQFYTINFTFNLNQGENVEINTINYIKSENSNLYPNPYSTYDSIYIEFLSNFKGTIKYSNGNQIINNKAYHSETKFIYTPEDECYISTIIFYSYKINAKQISSSVGYGFILCFR